MSIFGYSEEKWSGVITVGGKFELNVKKWYPQFYGLEFKDKFKLIRIGKYDNRLAEVEFPDKSIHVLFNNGILFCELNKSLDSLDAGDDFYDEDIMFIF